MFVRPAYLTAAALALTAGCIVPLDLSDADLCALDPAACDTAVAVDSDTLSGGNGLPLDTALPTSPDTDALDTDPLDTGPALPPGVLLDEDFSACPTLADWVLQGDWLCTTPPGAPGPDAAVEGTHLLATAPGTNYGPNHTWATSWAELPPVDLSGLTDPVIQFSAWAHTQLDTDGWNLSASANNGSTWQVQVLTEPAYDAILGGQLAWTGDRGSAWRRYLIDLSNLPRGATRLRFGFHSDDTVEHPGVHLDRIFVGERGRIPLEVTAQTLPAAQVGRPYAHTLTRAGGGSAVTWALGSTPAPPGWLTLDPATGTLSGTPNPSDIGAHPLSVRVSDDLFPGNTTTALLSVEVRADVGSWDFSLCPDGWTLQGDWACGTPTSGPGAAISGGVIATNLAGDHGNSRNWATDHATSPPMWLPVGDVFVQLDAWWNFETCCDGWHLSLVDRHGTVTPLPTSVPYDRPDLSGQPAWNTPSGGWVPIEADLSAWAGEQVQLRLAMRSDGTVTRPGAYIDSLRVTSTSTQYAPLSVLPAAPARLGAGDPYTFTPERSGGGPAITWSIEPSTPLPSWLSLDPNTGALSGTPAEADVGTLTVTLRATDVFDPSNTATQDITIEVLVRVAGWGFGACPDGWTLEGEWACGAPTSGPGAARSGGVLATNLAGDHGNNRNWTTDHATSPPIWLPDDDVYVRLDAWWNFELCCDGWHLAVLDRDGAITVLPTSVPYDRDLNGQPAWNTPSGGWVPIEADLTAWAGQPIQLRLAMRSDGTVTRPGAYVDNLRVLAPSLQQAPLSILPVHPITIGIGQPLSFQPLRLGGGPDVTWSVQPTTPLPSWLSFDPTDGTLSGSPAASDVGFNAITLQVADTLDPTNTATLDLVIEVRDHVAWWDFSSCPAGWTLIGPWQCGAPTSGPGAALSGNVLATVLDGNYPGSQNWNNNTATSPEIVLPAGTSTLSFTAWWSFEGPHSIYDGWLVAIMPAGGSPTTLTTSLPYSTSNLGGQPAWSRLDDGRGWQTITADLTPWAGQTVTVQFRMYSDATLHYPGAYIDEVRVD